VSLEGHWSNDAEPRFPREAWKEDEDEDAIAAALESVRQGKAVSVEVARARIDRILGR
jgi:hypothetical protein